MSLLEQLGVLLVISFVVGFQCKVLDKKVVDPKKTQGIEFWGSMLTQKDRLGETIIDTDLCQYHTLDRSLNIAFGARIDLCWGGYWAYLSVLDKNWNSQTKKWEEMTSGVICSQRRTLRVETVGQGFTFVTGAEL